MADEYIDVGETQVYGKFAREQMKTVCIGKVPELDGMVQFAISTQQRADKAMADALARQPAAGAPLDPAEIIPEARDVIVRFGSYLDSLKGRPVDPAIFFGGDAPSVLARRRLTKLTGATAHILEQIKAQKENIRDADLWIGEFKPVHKRLEALEKQQRATKVQRIEVGPELSLERERWLGVYNANKLLIRGLLAHIGKPELLPLIFDDLAEVHRTTGTSDELPPGVPAEPAEP